MPRKTLFLLIGLILVTIVLFVVALQTGKQAPKMDQAKIQATPTPDVAHTILSMSPGLVEVATGRQASVDVMIDPSDNPVSGVQLELLYDPTMISNVKVVSGPALPNPNVLIDKNDAQTGKYTYAYGIQPSQPAVKEKGVVAKITFTARGTVGKQSQIIMHPTTIVTATGVASSVLKMGTGATVVIVAPAVQGAKVKASPTQAIQ